ncbi:hypothetical protein BDY17DRAFT_333550 [Neohortaea acidophila]|uniref:Uncharacterized protein n=1 Tax=Neohortaea acidophila TaxID=245834 RepID=A0A6A6PXF8_9PEZI|nr:uncharacterized protein BDY17DRAFT_333550 [Neohortaea acidophila]KAF2484389.1 hypothetical protein BDY17DRAFT_333550 [Neohortaea acidophila]
MWRCRDRDGSARRARKERNPALRPRDLPISPRLGNLGCLPGSGCAADGLSPSADTAARCCPNRGEICLTNAGVWRWSSSNAKVGCVRCATLSPPQPYDQVGDRCLHKGFQIVATSKQSIDSIRLTSRDIQRAVGEGCSPSFDIRFRILICNPILTSSYGSSLDVIINHLLVPHVRPRRLPQPHNALPSQRTQIGIAQTPIPHDAKGGKAAIPVPTMALMHVALARCNVHPVVAAQHRSAKLKPIDAIHTIVGLQAPYSSHSHVHSPVSFESGNNLESDVSHRRIEWTERVVAEMDVVARPHSIRQLLGVVKESDSMKLVPAVPRTERRYRSTEKLDGSSRERRGNPVLIANRPQGNLIDRRNVDVRNTCCIVEWPSGKSSAHAHSNGQCNHAQTPQKARGIAVGPQVPLALHLQAFRQ